MVFPVVMYGCESKESWALKKWCFWTVVLEKTLESPLDCKETQPVHPKEISPGYSLEGLMLKLKLQYFGHLIQRTDSLEKTLMLGKIESRMKRRRQDEMVGWHHRLYGHGFGWTLGVGDGQGGLACCGSWGLKELDTTEWLNWTELKSCFVFLLLIFGSSLYVLDNNLLSDICKYLYFKCLNFSLF